MVAQQKGLRALCWCDVHWVHGPTSFFNPIFLRIHLVHGKYFFFIFSRSNFLDCYFSGIKFCHIWLTIKEMIYSRVIYIWLNIHFLRKLYRIPIILVMVIRFDLDQTDDQTEAVANYQVWTRTLDDQSILVPRSLWAIDQGDSHNRVATSF